MKILVALLTLTLSPAFADEYSNRVRGYHARQAAQDEQQAYSSAVSRINSDNENMLARVFNAAYKHRGNPNNLRCYTRGVLQAERFYNQNRDSSDTRMWRSARGYEIPVGVSRGANIPLTIVGTAVMMPFMLPHTLGSIARSAQAPVYPPQIGGCSFEVNSLACMVYPGLVRCVDGNGAVVEQYR